VLASGGLSRRRERRYIVGGSVPMDGDLADVEALAALCKRHDAAFILDEASLPSPFQRLR
jgi:7-keto-8-aminopelargonate synthetase-like enzyme